MQTQCIPQTHKLRKISFEQAKELHSLGLYVCCTHENNLNEQTYSYIKGRCRRRCMFHFEMDPADPFNCFVLVEESDEDT